MTQLLTRLFPQQQQALELLKQGETELNMYRNVSGECGSNNEILSGLLDKYFNPAVQMAPNLQLPLILRSKVLAEMGCFKDARADSQKAHSLNQCNKRGIVSEKLVGWMEQMKMKDRCKVQEFKQQINSALACITNSNASICSLANQLPSTINQVTLEDFNCSICLDTMMEPITVPCGHTCCRACLVDAMDHSSVCALCRTTLPPMGHVLTRSMDIPISNLLIKLFNKPIMPTKIQIPQQWVPLYECPLMFPNSTASFHISEARHRVMIKRCIETNRRFGCILPPHAGVNVNHGTIVQITKFEPLLSCDIISTVDGNLPRYVVEVQGVARFRIDRVEFTDAGYHKALVTRIEDIDYDTVPNWEPSCLENMVGQARQFVTQLLNSIPTTARLHFERKFGKMPASPYEFSFWLAEFLPLNPYILYQLLPLNTVCARMQLLCKWLQEACNQQCPPCNQPNPSNLPACNPNM
ncbi:hypothetical protein HK103_003431 [Boothiomyces macroporosus]|uniref:Uncharacterized protein n=1 Tax=Boothiomyces macroporosus TaxID=261099 RepID=A0AAD5Y936_9FUNG|nr:hypothetical protein HK103_003431 [Boothiomyces macroporosus]